MPHKLVRCVFVDGQKYSAGDSVPDEVAAKITCRAAWPDGKLPDLSPAPKESPRPEAAPEPKPAPKGRKRAAPKRAKSRPEDGE